MDNVYCADTGGSCRVPASLNGVAGLRPTKGCYIAGDGVVPLSTTRDTPGAPDIIAGFSDMVSVPLRPSIINAPLFSALHMVLWAEVGQLLLELCFLTYQSGACMHQNPSGLAYCPAAA